MIKRFNRGFTLIELLVVIAIIGILSSVVLASLNSARTKGADAAIKSNLANIRAQAEIYYDSNSNAYTGLCADATTVRAMSAAATAGGNTWASTAANATGMSCNAAANTWVAFTPLKSTNVVSSSSGTDYWCVDNTGVSKIVDANTNLTTSATACP